MSAFSVYAIVCVSFILGCIWLAWLAGHALERTKREIKDLESEDEQDASTDFSPGLQGNARAVLTERVYLRQDSP